MTKVQLEQNNKSIIDSGKRARLFVQPLPVGKSKTAYAIYRADDKDRQLFYTQSLHTALGFIHGFGYGCGTRF